jgi:hypothetical protein
VGCFIDCLAMGLRVVEFLQSLLPRCFVLGVFVCSWCCCNGFRPVFRKLTGQLSSS